MPASTPARIAELRRLGQSPWIDFIRRAFIDSGELGNYIRDGWLTGLTSNPTIFRKAIAGSTDYDHTIERIAEDGVRDPYDAFVRLAAEDIQDAADLFRPVYDETGGADGLVSHEAPPGIEHDYDRLTAEVRRLWGVMDRPNVMIKVPGTDAGIRAVEDLIAEGVNVNITLLFGVDRHIQVAEAYIRGLERRLEAGEPIDRIASVASFFVSRVDTKVDGRLPDGSPLLGTAAIANARTAYREFRRIFSGERWERLAAAGAKVQRPLWASTSTKNPAYPDVMYVDALVAPDTVNTMPETTLRAFADHGRTEIAITDETIAEAEETMRALEAAGIDMHAATEELLDEGIDSFEADFQALLECLDDALRARTGRWLPVHAALDPLESAVEHRLDTMRRDDVVRRLWDGDHTLWAHDPTEITDRLAWLDIDESMAEEAPNLEAFARALADEGYRTAVLLGMGGSSLAPEVMAQVFGAPGESPEGALDLRVLSTTDPAAIRRLDDVLDLERTLFIAASKSGTTVETAALLDYFWSRIPDGRHFIAITDPGTPLEQLAYERDFRRVFHAPPHVGGRYSALTVFGLVPAALAGAPIRSLLDTAAEVRAACDACVRPHESPGAWLGAVLGEAALMGRDKLTLVFADELRPLGAWIEQLVAESTGKQGRGILPVDGEPLGDPSVYGDDRLVVAIGDGAGLDDLEAAGTPVVRLPYHDPFQLGGEFYRWEFATAVAGHVLGINPFDQPDVQAAKDATKHILEGEPPEVETTPLEEVIDSAQPGDYVALIAYAGRTPELDAALQAARVRLRDRLHLATTVGYGPAYLHSTGQLHKGGKDNGLFLVHLPDDADDDLEVPGRPYTFGQLKRAQALGDLAALRERGRRVALVSRDDLEALAR